ncbi:YbaK/EbsC family protein [Ammoniphilus sp. CFH 90114]|uniref:YbaK/EbsC family protein n=1 Tax=Ammoniphilus sp. CFH 90114 TaxID=2493665 RepID=UPI00100EEC09|nr:YbaK/EbsC family protein [Ammoniphilus sp. CFH 90114]RXT07183.1 YbaK/EbsC family protein [Ammoniphilus sp. CFH 90114]
MPIARVRDFLKPHGLQPLVFEEKLHTSEEAANKLGVEVGQIAKAILFRSNEDNYGLFVAAGDVRVHPKKVKALLGGKKQKMASPDEVVEVTGFQVGAVCPFALRQDIPIYIDESIQRFDKVYTAAGIAESLQPISFDQLVKITNGIVIKASQED